MLHTTSEQLLQQLRRSNGSAGVTPMRLGASRDQQITGGEAALYTVPRGQVFLMTQFVQQVGGVAAGVSSAYDPSPAASYGGFNLLDVSGSTQSTGGFASFIRRLSVFDNGTDPTPSWLNSPPGNNVVAWKPKYPLAVFGGWTVQSSTTIGGNFHNASTVYGVLVDEDTARSMGFQVSGYSPDDTRRTFVTSATADATIAARAGQSIRILDVHVRLQPDTDRVTSGQTQYIELKQATDVRTLHKFINNNQSDMLEMQFSPADCWFLGENKALEIDFQGSDVGSITIMYEYVDANEVPGDVFWGSVSPTKPSPGLSTGAAPNPVVSTAVSLYFPGRYNLSPTPATAEYAHATPAQGEQYVLYGYGVSSQTLIGSGSGGAIPTPDQTLFTLSSGSTGGTIGSTQANYQLGPVFGALSHDHNVSAVVDDLYVPCAPSNGQIFVDTIGYGPATGGFSAVATPGNTNNGIDDWQVSVWGRANVDMVSTPTNQGV